MTVIISGTDGITSPQETITGGTVNGVAYLNGSKVLATGSALTFDGTTLANTIGGITNTGAFRSTVSTVDGIFGANQFATGVIGIGSVSNHPISFNINLNEQMRLTSTGLGIGTSSPAQKLHVSVATVGAGAFMQVSNTGDGQTAYFGTNTAGGSIQVNGAYPLQFATNGSERMRLDSSGNLGLGVTPSAWSNSGTTWKAIQAGSGSNFVGRGDVVQTQILTNAYYNGTNYIYQNSTSAAQYYQYQGAHAWGIAASGTAGTTATFTQAMTLDASGNLLVGGTSALATTTHSFYASGASGGAPLGARNNATSAGKYWTFGPDLSNNYRVFNQGGTGMYMVDGATSWTSSSDERLKDIIEPISDAANKVSTLRAVIGKFKTDAEGTRRSFLIAQDVQTVLPEAVDASNPDKLGVQYSEVIPLLVAAIKEQQAIITQLQADVAALKGTA
jgi:hypothetical protein